MSKKHLWLCVLAFAVTSHAYAANPASKDWVMQQISANLAPLGASDWNAICTSGSASSANGCYGNVSSAAFLKINNVVGDYTRYANINPVSAASSVFVKAFLAGTNTPSDLYNISVTLTNSAARCAMFTQEGFGIGPSGITTSAPSNGSSSGAFPPPTSTAVVSINSYTTGIAYNASNDSATVGGSPNQDPIYLLCVGYNTTDTTTAAAINVTAI